MYEPKFLYYPYHQWSQPDRLVLRSSKPLRNVYQHFPPPSSPLSLVFGHLPLTSLLAVQWKYSVRRHCHTHSRHAPDSGKQKKIGSNWLIILSLIVCILLRTTQNNKYDVFYMAKTKLMQNFILLQHSACICTCIPVIIIELDRCTGCKADSYQDNKDSIYIQTRKHNA